MISEANRIQVIRLLSIVFLPAYNLVFTLSNPFLSISETFNKLKLGVINFPKRINKVVKTFQHYSIFNNFHFFSAIAKFFHNLVEIQHLRETFYLKFFPIQLTKTNPNGTIYLYLGYIDCSINIRDCQKSIKLFKCYS